MTVTAAETKPVVVTLNDGSVVPALAYGTGTKW
jgi:hypothetical protein